LIVPDSQNGEDYQERSPQQNDRNEKAKLEKPREISDATGENTHNGTIESAPEFSPR